MAKKFFQSILLISLALGGSACSVRESSVVNEPPVYGQGLNQFKSEFGTLKTSSISFFYWPEGMTEEQAQEAVKIVNTASGLVDAVAEFKAKRQQLVAQFEALNCVTDFSVGDEDLERDPELQWVTKWKSAEGLSAEDQARLKQCMTNQEIRGNARPEVIKGLQDRALKAGAAALQIVGPTDRMVKADGTSIAIRSNPLGVEVQIELAGFMREGNIQSTHQAKDDGKITRASYDVRTRLLRFVVPELGEDGKPTGNIVAFALERGPDFLGMARFTGEARLMSLDGRVLRFGSAKFEGPMSN